MVRRVIGLAVVAALIAVGITWYAGRDDPKPRGGDDPRTEDELGCPLGEYANSDHRLERDSGGDLVVCHLVKQPLGEEPSYTLDWSRELGTRASRRVRAAIAAAPPGRTRFTGCDVADQDGPGEFFLVFAGPDIESVPYWVYNGTCGENGVYLVRRNGRLQRRLDTAEVLDALGSELGPLGPDQVTGR